MTKPNAIFELRLKRLIELDRNLERLKEREIKALEIREKLSLRLSKITRQYNEAKQGIENLTGQREMLRSGLEEYPPYKKYIGKAKKKPENFEF